MSSKIKDNKPITVAFETLGCKLNQAETELLSRQLTDAGCQIVSGEDMADIYILNTCTVTHIADRKSRHLLRMAHRRNPMAKIVALGCYADSSTKELQNLEGVDLVIGNIDKINLKQKLEDAGYLKPFDNTLKGHCSYRTRAFIKAQDGCNNFCTYCIVPTVRGREKSLEPGEVINEINNRVNEGYQEVVLTGTELGRYRNQDMDLFGLIGKILDDTGIRRLRLSSLQPQEIDSRLINLWENPRLCRHFHLSLQSGSESVLKRMNRHYTPSEYVEKVQVMRKAIPDVAITTDIIVGFPGETDKEYKESQDFCRQLDYSRIHVFPYSRRNGTQAAQMPGQCAPLIKKIRSEEMLVLAEDSQKLFYKKSLGKNQNVLFEMESAGFWTGYTDTYIKVYAKDRRNLTNRILPVELIEIHDDGVLGQVLE